MVVISVRSRPGSISLLDGSQFFSDPSARASEGVVNICVVSPLDGVALSVNENADPDVRTDHLAAIPRLHSPPGSLQSLLFRKTLTLPFARGRFSMGTWQGVYLIDLRSDSAMEPVSLAVTCRPSARRAQFSVNAAARDATQLEKEIAKRVPAESGALFVHEMHTSASLNLGSGNLEPTMDRVVPEKWHHEFFTHTMEGVDDMTGHLKCSLLGCSATVPAAGGVPMAPVRLNEHRYSGGWGGGHDRRILVDHLPAAPGKTAYDLPVEGMAEISSELAKAGDASDALVNVIVGKGQGGFLQGSRDAIENFRAPDDAVLAQGIDWPLEARAAGAQLWWRGGPAVLRVSPL